MSSQEFYEAVMEECRRAKEQGKAFMTPEFREAFEESLRAFPSIEMLQLKLSQAKQNTEDN